MKKGTTDWWDLTWNVTGGCAPVSAGCRNCYAPKPAATLLQRLGPKLMVAPLYAGTVDQARDRFWFNGKVNVLKPGHPHWTQPWKSPDVQQPLLGKGKPYLIFVNDMSDLFFEKVPTSVIDRVVATLAASDHIGLLLTRRTRRMAEYFAAKRLSPERLRRRQEHLWLGVSTERQREFDQHWPHMRELAARGFTVFVSIAPMLGPVVLSTDFLALKDRAWAICSGEQGPLKQYRDMDPNWARAVRDQCAAAGVPFFMKQMAGRKPIPPDLLIRQLPAA